MSGEILGLKDAMKVVLGKDLEEDITLKKKTSKKKTSTKTKIDKTEEKAEKKPERKPVASKEAIFAAYDYAANKDALSEDVRLALKDGSMSEDLRKLLQVLFDKKAVRDLVSAQGDVRRPEPTPEEVYFDSKFVHPDKGDECTEAAEKLLESGVTVEGLKAFNIELRVIKKRKDDKSVVADASKEEYKKVVEEIEAKFKKKGA